MTKIALPIAMSAAQSVVDYSTNCIYVIGSYWNSNVYIFDLTTNEYRINNDISIANYDSNNVMPKYHCVIPIYDSDGKVTSIVSFGGDDDSDHFHILERTDIDNQRCKFEWNDTNDLNDIYPRVDLGSRAININNCLVFDL